MAETLNLLAFLQQAHNEASQLETALQRQQEANAELEKELTLCQLQMRASNTTTEEESKLAAAREDRIKAEVDRAIAAAELEAELVVREEHNRAWRRREKHDETAHSLAESIEKLDADHAALRRALDAAELDVESQTADSTGRAAVLRKQEERLAACYRCRDDATREAAADAASLATLLNSRATLEAAVEEILREIRDATESLQLSEGYRDGIESSNRRLQDEIAALERILSRGGSAARV